MATRSGNWMKSFGYLAVFLSLFPSFYCQGGYVDSPVVAAHLKEHPESSPMIQRYSFGWPDSPLISYGSENTIAEKDGAISLSQTKGLTIGWVSWSSLTLAIGMSLVWLGKKLIGAPPCGDVIFPE